MDKPNARELLKETFDLFKLIKQQLEVANLQTWRIDEVIPRIDACLIAPSESAMEVVKKIRKNDDEIGFFHLTDSDAAALIEDHGRRVPRAFVEEIWEMSVSNEKPSDEFFDAIAAKYGVKVEG